MLYDRPYMRQPVEPDSRKVSMVTALLITTLAVFVVQQILNVSFPGPGGRDNPFLTEWFALSGHTFKELKVWSILSYAFLHSSQNLMHILGNMLGLFFIGRMIEPVLGKRNFLLLYLGGAFVGGLVYLAVHYNGFQPVVGASAAVFAILTFFCLLRPEQPITLLLFFVLPITVKPKWIFWCALLISIFSVVMYEIPQKSIMAHSAHLGGIFAGIGYFRFIHNRNRVIRFPGRASGTSVELPDWVKRKNKIRQQVSYRVNRGGSGSATATAADVVPESGNGLSRDALHKEVDRILDKINATGFGSLSEQEKRTLDNAKNLLRR